MITIQDISAFESMSTFIFVMGILAGSICTGIFRVITTAISLHYTIPSRIKTENGYLYRFRNMYVPLDKRNAFRSQAIQKYKQSRIKENL